MTTTNPTEEGNAMTIHTSTDAELRGHIMSLVSAIRRDDRGYAYELAAKLNDGGNQADELIVTLAEMVHACRDALMEAGIELDDRRMKIRYTVANLYVGKSEQELWQKEMELGDD
jgi:uncharacterized protein YgfB (UPF0149 family)